MRIVRLDTEIDFAGWRQAARALRAADVEPDQVIWTVDGEGDLFGEDAQAPEGGRPSFTVAKEFLELAQQVTLHRSGERFALLYRLLWRLGRESELLHLASDPDLAKARDMARAVSRAEHKMKAFVRFRLVEDAQEETYVAWFEPAHRVTEAVAPFFVRRFANMNWSILTPDVCAHWNRSELSFTAGADPADAPGEDALEEYWRTYYVSIFNPARLKVSAMQREMPKRYWRNLPEARLIPELIAAAEERADEMVRQSPTEPSRRVVRRAQRLSRDGSFEEGAPSTLEEVTAGVDFCRRCELWRDATQGVAGAGLATARLMLVGEQPGDQEDLAGEPFVGPAGKVLDEGLAAAGVPRTQTFITNAVKHFRHEVRGKRRIHQTPTAAHVSACRWWLDAERRIVRPRVILALGATAALGVFGKPMAIGRSRGQALQLADQAKGLVTYHPSFLLRVPDETARKQAFDDFVQDLKLAWSLAGAGG